MDVDIWSCGVILYALLCGCQPFEDKSTSAVYDKILSGKFKKPSHLSQDALNILEKILTQDPEKRIKIPDIKEHEFFKKHNSNQKPDQGIIIGKDSIPIDFSLIDDIEIAIGFKKEKVLKAIEANNHNIYTTTYYLRQKSLLLNGDQSKADINSTIFDESLLKKLESKKIDGKSVVSMSQGNENSANIKVNYSKIKDHEVQKDPNYGGTGGTSTIDGNIKKHSNITECQDSMIKVKNRTIETSYGGIKQQELTYAMDSDKKEDQVNMGLSGGKNSNNDGLKDVNFKKTNKEHARTYDHDFDTRKRSINKKDNNYLLGESISFEKSYDKPSSTIPMPTGQQLGAEKQRKNFGTRDSKDRSNGYNNNQTNSIESNYAKKDDSKRKISAKRASKNAISNRVIDNDPSILPKLDHDSKKDKIMNSSIIANPNSANKKSNKMIRQKNSKNAVTNNSSINSSQVAPYYQYIDDKYSQSKYMNSQHQPQPQKMAQSNILQNVNQISKITNKRKKTNTGNSSMRSDYDDIKARSQSRDQSRDHSFVKDVYRQQQPTSNAKSKVTTGSRKNSTSVNRPRPKPNVSSYYNYSLNVSRHGKY